MLTDFSQVQSTQQGLTFLYATGFGMGLCILYDFYRSFCQVFFSNKWIEAITDICYCTISAVLCFCFLLVECTGQLRFYAFLGFGCGFLLFRKLISKYIRKLLAFLLKIGSQIIYTPIFLLFKIINKYIGKVLWIWKKALKSIKLFSKKKEKPLANDGNNDV